MEISKSSFRRWFGYQNLQIAGNAMRVQWTALLENNNPFFSEDELWEINPKLAAESLCLSVYRHSELLPAVIAMLQRRLSEGKQLPFQMWLELLNLASYLLKGAEDKYAILDFVAQQKFEESDLWNIIDSALRCVDRMPEWKEVALKWIDQVEPDVNFCIVVQKFLIDWGRLDEHSNKLIISAFDNLLPDWAPLMIKSLTNVPGPYRYDMSLFLLKKYFSSQSEELIKAIIGCFDKDSDVILQQKLLNGIFDLLNQSDCQASLSTIIIFIDGIKFFLKAHWADNCFKFAKLWDKYHDAPEIFDAVRSAFNNDEEFIWFDKGSKDPLAKLKTPFHMLCYLPVVNRVDLCLILLRAVDLGDRENKDLACHILIEHENSLQFDACFDDYVKELTDILHGQFSINYEMSIFASAIVNSLVKYGPEVKDIERLYGFVSAQRLNVPAMYERYGHEIDYMLQQRKAEKEILDYLLKH